MTRTRNNNRSAEDRYGRNGDPPSRIPYLTRDFTRSRGCVTLPPVTHRTRNPLPRLALAAALAALAVALLPAASPLAQEPERRAETEERIPGSRRAKPDLTDVDRLRIVTESDYPPFNYLDEDGVLTGFNVDLARAICDELAVECDIRSVEWDTLVPALHKAEADAAIASIRKTSASLEKLDFTDSYYFTPARFVALKSGAVVSTRPEELKGRRVAVQKDTAHEAYLRDFFPGIEMVPFDDVEKAKEALKAGEVDVLFGDGLSLMFWLNGTSSSNCCEFRGGAYFESRYFGEGVGIAVQKDNRTMLAIFNYGLALVRSSPRFEELLLRYFPLNAF
ncbi:MAG: transporter substrate-binding domain-containing protein [Hyphomicrobiales bacterium]